MSHLIAATPADLLWPRPLEVRYLDGFNWEVLADFQFCSPSPEFPSICVPAGFVTDFASIPRFFWRWMPPTDRRIGKMAVVHDRFYRDPTVSVTKSAADDALRAGMVALGASKLDREVVWAAVHLFGTGAYQPRRIA